MKVRSPNHWTAREFPEAQKFKIFQLFIPFFCFCFWYHIQEPIAKSKVTKIYHTFSSKSFIVLAVTFRSLIHFE